MFLNEATFASEKCALPPCDTSVCWWGISRAHIPAQTLDVRWHGEQETGVYLQG